MEVDVAIAMLLVLVLGTGMFLAIPGQKNLAGRAKELGLWPDREDFPGPPWTLFHAWTFTLMWDVAVRTRQTDHEYLALRRRVRLGVLLALLAAAGFVALFGTDQRA